MCQIWHKAVVHIYKTDFFVKKLLTQGYFNDIMVKLSKADKHGRDTSAQGNIPEFISC